MHENYWIANSLINLRILPDDPKKMKNQIIYCMIMSRILFKNGVLMTDINHHLNDFHDMNVICVLEKRAMRMKQFPIQMNRLQMVDSLYAPIDDIWFRPHWYCNKWLNEMHRILFPVNQDIKSTPMMILSELHKRTSGDK